jgi:Kinesin motor domain
VSVGNPCRFACRCKSRPSSSAWPLQEDTSFTLQCSFFEIYNEVSIWKTGPCELHARQQYQSISFTTLSSPLMLQHITDLLTPRSEKSLSVRVHPKHGPFVDGLSAEPVSSGELMLLGFSMLKALPDIDLMKLLDDIVSHTRLTCCCSMYTAAAEVLALMQRGADNRRVAATQLNDQSSRSHSIFTAVVEVLTRQH